MRQGSLVVIGSGIKAIQQITMQARDCIKAADRVLYGVCDPFSEEWIKQTNPKSESLTRFYGENKPRIDTYNEMIEQILDYVRSGIKVCAVFYGHPGVFVYPSHEAIKIARREGYKAIMLPGISTEDCLFADLAIDPAVNGYQSFEATDFVLNGRRLDPTCSVILWQIDCVGDDKFYAQGYDARNLPVLVEALSEFYDLQHEVTLYAAPVLPMCNAITKRLTLGDLRKGSSLIEGMSTLYIPPAKKPEVDHEMLQRLGLTVEDLSTSPNATKHDA